ncbi:MAG: Asp-tRNA(Asn)/Glu-tRNA(Gln) amidotransferase subunit GatA [Candidatus Shapirobacteria bacterium]
MISDLSLLTINEVQKQLSGGLLTPTDLLNFYLKRVEKYDPQLQAFITPTPTLAKQWVEKLENKIRNKTQLGKLAGLPLAVKDIFLTEGVQSTAGSQILKGFIPPYSSTVYQRLIDEDAILVGKTNTDPFAFGASTENSGYFPTKNPWDKTRIPGGSSGGSAAAIAGGLAHVALGTDTGGSIRQPASMCGVSGIKPTYGRNSRYGITAMASSFDCPGALARHVSDLALVTEIMAGADPCDATSSTNPVPQYSQLLNSVNLLGLKIGIPKEYFSEGIDLEVKTQVMAAAELFQKQGAILMDISLPSTSLGIDVYYTLVPCEISANMARYDGVRFGQTAQNTTSLIDTYFKTRGQFLEPELKRRILIGTYALSSGYYDAYYIKASQIRTLIKQEFENALRSVDIILAPVSPTTAWPLGEKVNDPLAMYLADVNTVCVNVAGLPALALPCGFDSKSLPIGFQIIGNYFQEANLFSVGHQFQQLTDYHLQLPPL